MQCLIIIALSCAVTGQSRLPFLTRLLQPTLLNTPSQVDFYDTLKLTPPPPPIQQPDFSPSPQFLLPTSSEPHRFAPASLGVFSGTIFSETSTSLPLLSPTTIKFTLDDVSAYFDPQLIPPVLNIKLPHGTLKHGSPTHVMDSPSKKATEGDSVFSATVINDEPAEYQWILTSGERSPLKSDTQRMNDSKTGGTKSFEEPLIKNEDTVFLPSLSFPFRTDPTKELVTHTPIEEERFVAAASNLQSQPLQFAESSYNFFAIKPIKIEAEEDSEGKTFLQEIKNNRPLSKTPVPQVVYLGEEIENSVEEEVTNESPPTRRVLQFDQEFLTLLKLYHAQDKEVNKTTPPSSDIKPFWLDENPRGKADLAKRLKNELPTALLSIFKPSQVPKTEKSFGGVFTTSLRGLTSTTTSNVELAAAGKTSEGPKVVPVGEVGELLHEGQGSEAGLEAPLSAAFRHGVQSINVSAWVSGCPKLYGKVKLNCAVHHDSLAKAAMVSFSYWCMAI